MTEPLYPHFDYGGYPPPPVAPRHRPSRRGLAGLVVLTAVIAGAVGAVTGALVADSQPQDAAAGLAITSQQAPPARSAGSAAVAAAKIGPSVVTINILDGNSEITGSGVIIRSDGYILTNNHVVSSLNGSAGQSVEVTLADGRQAIPKVIGNDPLDDLAVIKVNLTGLPAARFAASSSLVVGQSVLAVGAPLGLSDTVTAGIVSNTARPVQTVDGNSAAVFDAVQTDAPINPGNSGGPLADLDGDVVGINAAIASDSSQGGLQVPGQQEQQGNIGIGYAIPSSEAYRIAAALITTGKVTHALMGVSVSDPTGLSTGARVVTVTAGTGAAKAGIKVGDVITRFNHQLIDDATSLVAAVRSNPPGAHVTVVFTRSGSTHTVSLVLQTAPN